MTPQDAILALANQKVSSDVAYRMLLDHKGWWVPRPDGATRPTIMITDAAMTPTVWLFSSKDEYERACVEHDAAAIGPVAELRSILELVADLDPQVGAVRIDPSAAVAFTIQADELGAFGRTAGGMLVERAIADRELWVARQFGAYCVLYTGVVGEGHEVVTVPSEHGNMLVAFTTSDAVEAFLATGSDDDRAGIKAIAVDGETLFGQISTMASGIVLNPEGPRTFGFQRAMCKQIATAIPRGRVD